MIIVNYTHSECHGLFGFCVCVYSDQFTALRQMGQYHVGHADFGLYRFKVGDLTFRIGRGVGVPISAQCSTRHIMGRYT